MLCPPTHPPVVPPNQTAGLDLSPHMLAVGSYMQRQRQAQRAAAGQPPEQLTLLHGLGEDTKLPAESFDLVSVMLVRACLPAASAPAAARRQCGTLAACRLRSCAAER